MRKILILSAVDDESVGFQFEFLHETLHGGIQVREEGGVVRVEICQRLNLPLGDDQ